MSKTDVPRILVDLKNHNVVFESDGESDRFNYTMNMNIYGARHIGNQILAAADLLERFVNGNAETEGVDQ